MYFVLVDCTIYALFNCCTYIAIADRSEQEPNTDLLLDRIALSDGFYKCTIITSIDVNIVLTDIAPYQYPIYLDSNCVYNVQCTTPLEKLSITIHYKNHPPNHY